MDKKSKYLFATIFVIIVVCIVAVTYKTIILQDFKAEIINSENE